MKNNKMFNQLIPGIGSTVVNGNLNSAIRLWKNELKKSEKLSLIFEKQSFKKQSVIKKQVLNKAKYRQLKQTEELNQ